MKPYGTTTIKAIVRPCKPKPIYWENRYSNTMEDDHMARWARVAYAGRMDSMGVFRGKVCSWEIAWISKMHFNKQFLGFTVTYRFPSNECSIFQLKDYTSVERTFSAAKKSVDRAFKHFIRNVVE